MQTATATRRKRFRRQQDAPIPRVQLTEDDHEALLHVYRRRLITSHQLFSLFPTRSAQKLSRRYAKLVDVGLLDIPGAQLKLWKRGSGSLPYMFAIKKAGVDLLNARYNLGIPYSRWSRRNDELKPQSIEHMLGTSDYMVKLERSARQHDHITYDDGFGILSGLPDRRYDRPKPLSFETEVMWHRRKSIRGIEPDELMRIHNANERPGRQIANFAIEIDRDTETVEPSANIQQTEAFFKGSTILKKYVIYANAWRNRAMLKPFGFKTFRVLFITTTPGHMQKFQALAKKYVPSLKMTPQGVFLFSNQEIVEAHADNLLSAPWETETGKVFYLDGVKR